MAIHGPGWRVLSRRVHLWEIVHSSRWARLPPRTTILQEDQSGKSMFLPGMGKLKVIKRGRLLNVLNAGECFGEMAFIQGAAARQATVEAMTDGRFRFTRP